MVAVTQCALYIQKKKYHFSKTTAYARENKVDFYRRNAAVHNAMATKSDLSTLPFIHSFKGPWVHPFINLIHSSIHPSVHRSIHTSIHPCTYPYIHPSTSLSFYPLPPFTRTDGRGGGPSQVPELAIKPPRNEAYPHLASSVVLSTRFRLSKQASRCGLKIKNPPRLKKKKSRASPDRRRGKQRHSGTAVAGG